MPSPDAVAAPNVDEDAPRPRNWKKLIAFAAWLLLAVWLVGSIVVSVVKALASGSGPLVTAPTPPTAEQVGPAQPGAAPGK
jgi:hypothetical protein